MSFSENNKVKIGISACLLGTKCNFNGSDLLSPFLKDLEAQNLINFISFCPEDSVFQTPRPNLRIVDGDGFDVLDRRASVINELGQNVTLKQIEGSTQFLNFLKKENVSHAILMDGSPSCGSNVLLKEENWPRGGFKRGTGVATALLRRNGIVVLSSFDERSISYFFKSINNNLKFKADLKDLKDIPKFKVLFEGS